MSAVDGGVVVSVPDRALRRPVNSCVPQASQMGCGRSRAEGRKGVETPAVAPVPGGGPDAGADDAKPAEATAADRPLTVIRDDDDDADGDAESVYHTISSGDESDSSKLEWRKQRIARRKQRVERRKQRARDEAALARAADSKLTVEPCAIAVSPGSDPVRWPSALCQFDGRLSVGDGSTIYEVDGLLGSFPPELSVTAALLTTVHGLPKELARIIAEYTPSAGTRLIAGTANSEGRRNGHALREAQLWGVSAVAVDTSDAAAGPQLIISEFDNEDIRCLNLHTETMTTLAGANIDEPEYLRDGPASQATFSVMYGVAVASDGVVFVANYECVRRISAPTRSRLRPFRCRCCRCCRRRAQLAHSRKTRTAQTEEKGGDCCPKRHSGCRSDASMGFRLEADR